jgi:thioredoxin reductase (NADPH)
MRYDIAIVGTGPAGISAAITSKIRNKNLILIGSKTLSSKISQGHTIENYPGLPEISGEELAQTVPGSSEGA